MALGAAALAWTFVRADLPVPGGDLGSLPAAPHVDGLVLRRLPTATIASQHGFSVRGAPITAPFTSAMVAFVVQHPRGTVLIDAGMGSRGREHVSTVPYLMQAIVDLQMRQGTADGLRAGGIAPAGLWGVILTHGHWDHVSGLQDLPGVPVWMTTEEQAYVAEDGGGLLYRQIDAERPVDVRTLTFPDGPYGPFAASWDVFDDGSLVVLPLPGHTPGSVAVLVNGAERTLFVGDTSWTQEGVAWPAEKPWVTRRMVDHDPAGVREQLVFLHRMVAANPGLVVVPAHDERVHARVPTL
ncbi:MAG: MBL fold metallo-hydrolase [Myxococcales bacterium]|nr:MBL fold metallo-hydrolase [Myxococcales bacterium]